MQKKKKETTRTSQVVLEVKNLPANAGDMRGTGLFLESGRSPGGGHGNPLQYSCLENPTDRGAWRATVHRAAESQTWLKRRNKHAHSTLIYPILWAFKIVSWVSLVVQMVKNLPAVQETHVWSLSQENPLEKRMATLSSIFAWRIPWTEKPGGL